MLHALIFLMLVSSVQALDLEEAQAFVDSLPSCSAASEEGSHFAQNLLETHVKETKGALTKDSSSDKHDLMIFISTSMPEVEIKAYSLEAQKYGGVLVIKGLIKESFRETILALQKMTPAGFVMDPQSFADLDVKAVPSIVLRRGKQYDKISGSVTVGHALRSFGERGDLKDLAHKILGAS